MNLINLTQNNIFLMILVIWEIVWKGLALWFASKNNQKIWYVAILLINSIGIIPLVYLVFFRKDKKLIEALKPLIRKVLRKKP